MLITVKGSKGKVCAANFGEHQIRLDQPNQFGTSAHGVEPVMLLAAGLGGCIYISIFPFLERRGLATETVEVEVEMAVFDDPKRIGSFSVGVKLPAGVADRWLPPLRKIASLCIVHGTLTRAAEIEVELERPDRPGEI